MSMSSIGSAFGAAQMQAIRQAPQGEQVAGAAVAAANQLDPQQIGIEDGQSAPQAQSSGAAHLGVYVDTEA